MIKDLELDRLSNTKNAILYSLSSSLIPCIKEYCDKGIGSTTALQATLIYLANKKVGGKPSSFFALAFILIIFLVNSFQL